MYPLLILCLEPTRFGVLLYSMSGDVPRGSREKTFEAAYCWFIEGAYRIIKPLRFSLMHLCHTIEMASHHQ